MCDILRTSEIADLITCLSYKKPAVDIPCIMILENDYNNHQCKGRIIKTWVTETIMEILIVIQKQIYNF